MLLMNNRQEITDFLFNFHFANGKADQADGSHITCTCTRMKSKQQYLKPWFFFFFIYWKCQGHNYNFVLQNTHFSAEQGKHKDKSIENVIPCIGLFIVGNFIYYILSKQTLQ